MKTAVAVLAKAPEPGKVKTRFCPPCTPEQAAQFATAFLLDTAAMLSSPAVAGRIDTFISYAGNDAQLTSLVHGELLLQRGDDLGHRIGNAIEDLSDRGYERIAVLAADCPTVDEAYFLDVIDALDSNDIVFGPARDGGCVVVGLSGRHPTVFTEVPMSTDHVLVDMMQVAKALGLGERVMESRFDLDTYADLISALNAGELAHAKHTLEAVAEVRLNRV